MFVVRKDLEQTLPKTSCPGHAVAVWVIQLSSSAMERLGDSQQRMVGLCADLSPTDWTSTWRGTFYSLDSENAIEPCISAFTDCLSWSTLDWVVALLVQVCDKICPVCQLSPLPKSGCPNERWRRLNIKCQHVSTFCSLSCQRSSQAWRKRTVLYSLASKFDPWVYSLFLRRMRPLGGWKSKGLEW